MTGGFPARLWAPWGQDQGQIHFHGPLAMAMELGRWTDSQSNGSLQVEVVSSLRRSVDYPFNPKIMIVTESCLNDVSS